MSGKSRGLPHALLERLCEWMLPECAAQGWHASGSPQSVSQEGGGCDPGLRATPIPSHQGCIHTPGKKGDQGEAEEDGDRDGPDGARTAQGRQCIERAAAGGGREAGLLLHFLPLLYLEDLTVKTLRCRLSNRFFHRSDRGEVGVQRSVRVPGAHTHSHPHAQIISHVRTHALVHLSSPSCLTLPPRPRTKA